MLDCKHEGVENMVCTSNNVVVFNFNVMIQSIGFLLGLASNVFGVGKH